MKITPPPDIALQLERGAPIAISVSGGKDSDAMTYGLIQMVAEHGYTGSLHLIHADLGRAELRATPEYVRSLAGRTGLPLSIVQHSKFDLLDGIRHRMQVRPEVPPWPSPSLRQCTSDWKRGPISKWIRNTFPEGNVISTMGLRADESPARARKPTVKLREDCCSRARQVTDWLPIHHFSKADVWSTIGTNPHHPAYDAGNDRVSCALCIMANERDLLNGAMQDVELFRSYCDIEIQSGFSFRQKLWLGVLAPHLLREDQVEFYKTKYP